MVVKKSLLGLLTSVLLFGGCLRADRRINQPQLNQVRIYFVKNEESGELEKGVGYDVRDKYAVRGEKKRAILFNDGFDGDLDRVEFFGHTQGSYFLDIKEGDKRLKWFEKPFRKAEKDVREIWRYTDKTFNDKFTKLKERIDSEYVKK